jgi:RNA polymerase-binding protein DksA
MPKQRNKTEYEQLRELLLRKRNELNQRIEERRREIAMELEPKDAAGVALRNSFAGMAVANIEREVRNLAEIDLSLRRMETGEYGTCGLCGDKIPLARLKAIPWTRCCVECAGGSRARREQSTQPPGDVFLGHA